jgi:hypothetical protein
MGPTQPLIQWVSRTHFQGVKWSERELITPKYCEVKSAWIFASTPPTHLREVALNQLRTQITLPFNGIFGVKRKLTRHRSVVLFVHVVK